MNDAENFTGGNGGKEETDGQKTKVILGWRWLAQDKVEGGRGGRSAAIEGEKEVEVLSSIK
jgi:hypothetical protein